MTDYRLLDVAQANYALVEALYERYQKDPKSVSPEWIDVFKTLELIPLETAKKQVFHPKIPAGGEECRISSLIDAYRSWGYLAVPVNPIAKEKVPEPYQLKMENLGFYPEELSKNFPTLGLLEKTEAP